MKTEAERLVEYLSVIPIEHSIDNLLADYLKHDFSTIEEYVEQLPDDVLAHYGVLGQKWGVRNAESRRRIAREKNEGTSKKSSKRADNSLKSNPQNRRLSDAELRQKIERLRLEQELARLTPRPAALSPKEKTRMRKMLEDTAFDVAKGALTEVGKAALTQALKTQYNKRAKGAYKIAVKAAKG